MRLADAQAVLLYRLAGRWLQVVRVPTIIAALTTLRSSLAAGGRNLKDPAVLAAVELLVDGELANGQQLPDGQVAFELVPTRL